jgi:DNA-binding winged helix-turn-helix (wHTH) protein
MHQCDNIIRIARELGVSRGVLYSADTGRPGYDLPRIENPAGWPHLQAVQIEFFAGQFELSESDGELRENGIRIKLQEQPFQVLIELLASAGRVVSREQLQQKLWSADTFVDFDVGLNTAIRKLRLALGDDAESPRYIETSAKRGYRFLAPVNIAASAPEFVSENVTPAEPLGSRAGARPEASGSERVSASKKHGHWYLMSAFAVMALAAGGRKQNVSY